jgi:hypothetical protein
MSFLYVCKKRLRANFSAALSARVGIFGRNVSIDLKVFEKIATIR